MCVIFHSDKGGEYTGDLFAGPGARHRNIPESIGRVGSRWTTRRPELQLDSSSTSCCPAAASTPKTGVGEVAVFIDRYNHRRRHSTCEMKPPVVFEQILADRSADQDKAA